MRYIPTSAAMVDSLKKQAKKLQRKGGGKHADLLDRIARGAGYLHWHHVTLCQKQTQAKTGLDALQAECEIVLAAAREGKTKIIVTGPETLAVPLVLFSSANDAWLLDAEENMALCLMFGGAEQERVFEDTGPQVRIDWDGTYALDGDAFAVATEHPQIGKRVIAGYPIEDLRRAIDRAQSFDKRFRTLMVQEDAVNLTPELMQRLVVQGWDPKMIENAKADGARYSPSRNSLLTPQVFGGFDDDDDDGPPMSGAPVFA